MSNVRASMKSIAARLNASSGIPPRAVLTLASYAALVMVIPIQITLILRGSADANSLLENGAGIEQSAIASEAAMKWTLSYLAGLCLYTWGVFFLGLIGFLAYHLTKGKTVPIAMSALAIAASSGLLTKVLSGLPSSRFGPFLEGEQISELVRIGDLPWTEAFFEVSHAMLPAWVLIVTVTILAIWSYRTRAQ